MAWNLRLLFHKHLLKRSVNDHGLLFQKFLHNKPAIILGIETSCDDTACGIVDEKGVILGEGIHSQHIAHLNFGGIIPTLARDMHVDNVTRVCEDALRSANLKLKDIDAIAVTVKPGLPMSLEVGARFGKSLAQIGKKPFIPIHHMEAHALTARLNEKVDFPYLVLLISGGHCLLAIVKNVDQFYLLGTTIDKAPGDLFDKVARRLKLRNIPEFKTLNGGQAVENAACKASDIDKFFFDCVMRKYRNCNFSFSGIQSTCDNYIKREESRHNIVADMIIPDVYNLCAAVQLAVAKHICERTQRAMEFIDEMSLIPKDKRTLVVSGGVACNNFLAKALNIVCTELEYKFVRTPPKLCTDNGIMIAWNGIERWTADIDVIRNQDEIDKVCVQNKAPLGIDWTQTVEDANLKCLSNKSGL
ncbi:threonyl-carbamoyl synthesis 4 isoform X2 [Calliopsis andreniformis]|uniref:threonyl-carbamoyl synthesis 4 isoform X2 n=1 Tax=Calliopsis andreniformis TaxID=337506 RepID=UPI003FCDD2BB